MGETLAVVVLDCAADLVVQGLLDDVLELVIELDAVFVAPVVLVEVVEAVVVLEDVIDVVSTGLEEEVLDTETVRVEVMDAVVVFVLVEEGVFGNVGSDDLDAVVVFVAVFDCVDDCVGTTPRFLWIAANPYSGTGTWHIAGDPAGDPNGGPEVSAPSKA